MHYHQYPLIALLGLFLTLGYGQTSEEPAFEAEQLLIQTDRQLYISGEIIWFKVFAFRWEMDHLSDFSQVAYLELISPDRIAVSRVKIKLEKGRGNGTFELPRALNSGSYELRAYTQSMRNGEETDFGRSRLIILNPDQAVVRADPDQADTYAAFAPESADLAVSPNRLMQVSVRPQQTPIGQRNEAVLEITTTDPEGRPVAAELSLSVALQLSEETGAKPIFKLVEEVSPFDPWRPDTLAYLPEKRGMRLNGRVIDEATQNGAPEVTLFLAFPGEVAMVYLEETDDQGNFSFLLPDLYGLRQVVLQTHPDDSRSLRLELKEEFHTIPTVESQPFVLPPEWVPLANAALMNAEVQRSYQAFELPPVYEVKNPFDSIPFFGRLDARYRLDDYTRFPIPEFFFEVVYQVMVKGKYGSERLEVINDWDRPFADPDPLFLVDGVPVFDQRAFLKINNKLIEWAEIVTEPFWLNPLFYNGIIQLKSFERDGRCIRLPANALQRSFLTLLPERQFSIPDYDSQADSRLPDFRNTLYWNPMVRTDENGKATVRFFTGDSPGHFEIHLEGVSDEGYLGSGSGKLEVVKLARDK
jgi:hypothetical protein